MSRVYNLEYPWDRAPKDQYRRPSLFKGVSQVSAKI